MPLRSVEAATREDAIAAAREQFGPTARVVGIRRVRSGGVLGFFATERYVAEVDPDNPTSTRPSRPAEPAAARTPRAERASAERASAELQQKVKELVGLLGTETAEQVVPTYTRSSVHRAPAPRTAEPAPPDDAPAIGFPAAESFRTSITASLLKSAQTSPAPWIRSAASALAVETDEDDEDDDAPEPGESLPPSPFTAALARMVAGDRSVREAVREALEEPALEEPAADAPVAGNTVAEEPAAADVPVACSGTEQTPVEETSIQDAWFAWIEQATAPARSADTGAEHHGTGAEHHEEETPVAEQQAVPPSLGTAGGSEEFPAWAAEPEPAPAPASSREEEIAGVLRAALAQGHSDETLADILRKVLAGVSPQVTLPAEPAAPAEPPVTTAAASAAWTDDAAAAPLPGRPHAEPLLEEPAWTDERVPLWADVAPADHVPAEVRDDEPIWAEVVLHEPAPAVAAAEVVAGAVAAPAETDADADAAAAADADADELLPETAELLQEVTAEAPPVVDPWATEQVVEWAEPIAVPAETAEPVPVAAAATVEAPLLARTASDPAPLPLDATAVLPPLSLLPPRPSGRRGGGLPPVPPPSRPAVPPSARTAASSAVAARAETPAPQSQPRMLATVTRLPVAPLDDVLDAPAETGEAAEPIPAPVGPRAEALPAPTAPAAAPEPPPARPAPVEPAVPQPVRRPSGLVGRLRALGLPEWLLGDAFVTDAAAHGTYAALVRALGNGLPKPAELPSGAGEVLLVVGPGVETLVAARSLAASLRLDPDRVQWASRGELAGLAPANCRMSTVEAAIDRRQEAAGAGTLTIVAVDAPLRTDGHWMGQMLAIWTPAAVWAVVDATRKPEDVEPWLDGLPRVDALVVQDTDLSADPAAVLQRIATPVAVLDGVLATPHRWASVLCERLEKQQG